MRKRYVFGFGVFVLAILLTLVVWQGSFTFGEYGPTNPEQTIRLLGHFAAHFSCSRSPWGSCFFEPR